MELYSTLVLPMIKESLQNFIDTEINLCRYEIDYLKKESEQVLLNAKKHQSKLKEEQDKLLKVVKSQERKDDTRRKILLGSWVLNKIKHDESFKHQLSDFEQFLNTENKTESNRQKDKDLFKDILF